MENTKVTEFTKIIMEAETILHTLYSVDLAEPSFRQCLSLVKQYPELQEEFTNQFIFLLKAGKISSQTGAYLMYSLRWEAVKELIYQKLSDYSIPLTECTFYNKILYAYELEDEWEDKDCYTFKD